MKKIGVIIPIILIGMAVIFTACASGGGRIVAVPGTPHEGYMYRVIGERLGNWQPIYDEQYVMENVGSDDPRVSSIAALRDAAHIYVYEYNVAAANLVGWNVQIPGPGIDLNGKYAVKVLRLIDEEGIGDWFMDMWIPSREAGGVRNLTPDTLYCAPDRTEDEANEANDGMGHSNDNPVLLQGDATYYIVFAVMNDRSRAMGAIKK